VWRDGVMTDGFWTLWCDAMLRQDGVENQQRDFSLCKVIEHYICMQKYPVGYTCIEFIDENPS